MPNTRSGDVDLRHAKEVKERLAPQLLRNPNVTGVGVGYKVVGGRRTQEICVRVYVRKKLPREALRPEDVLPRVVENVPIDVIEATFKPLVSATALEDRKTRHDPMQGGISIGRLSRESAGTLGSWAVTEDSRELVLLSNWHVLCRSATCAAGEPIVQPGTIDGGGENDIVALLHRAALTSLVDGAIARLTGSRALLQEALGLGPVSDVAEPVLGMRVRKSGRTTGVTTGTVTDVSATGPIDYDGIVNLFVDQVMIEDEGGAISLPGDSGSVWIDDDNWLVGLLFAGSDDGRIAVANPMLAVLEALGISVGLSILDVAAASELLG